MSLRRLRAPAFVVVVAIACTKTAPPASDAAVVERAQAALTPYQGALKAELGRALAPPDGATPDVAAAISVCADRAPKLAREHSQGGARVGRSSAKLRNPDNAAPTWLTPMLADFAKLPSGSHEHRVVALDGGRWGYAEPIWIQPACLTCHGEALAPAVDEELRRRYPSDAARGFHVGELRGAFWVELAPP